MTIKDIQIGQEFRVSMGRMPSITKYVHIQDTFKFGMRYNARTVPGAILTLIEDDENCVLMEREVDGMISNEEVKIEMPGRELRLFSAGHKRSGN